MSDKTDIISCIVSSVGSLFVWSNVYKLWKDKEIKGVHLSPAAYAAFGGCWSAYFIHHLNQHYAFYGSLLTVAGNFTWVIMASIFSYRK